MQTDMSYLNNLIAPDYSKDKVIGRDGRDPRIEKLTYDEKIWLAVQRVLQGHDKSIYFSSGHMESATPFRLRMKDRVIEQLHSQGFEVEDTREDRDNGTSFYGSMFLGSLDGVLVSFRKKD